jgi:heat shock protein HslJ
MKMRRLLVMGLMVWFSWGCTSAPAAIVPQATTTVATDVLRGEWILQQMKGEALDELTVSLDIQDNQISGVSFCNNYNSTITVNGNSLIVDPAIAATKMFCPEGDTMQREQTYFETLGKVKTYTEVDGRLELRDETGTPVLVYQR